MVYIYLRPNCLRNVSEMNIQKLSFNNTLPKTLITTCDVLTFHHLKLLIEKQISFLSKLSHTQRAMEKYPLVAMICKSKNER